MTLRLVDHSGRWRRLPKFLNSYKNIIKRKGVIKIILLRLMMDVYCFVFGKVDQEKQNN